VTEISPVASELVKAGQRLHEMGMVPASGGNLSIRLDDGNYAITRSGVHKGYMEERDILAVDDKGQSLDNRKPSAETLLHIQLYRFYPEVEVVFHVHSKYSTLLSFAGKEKLIIKNYEFLKIFPGIDTHATAITVPIFKNDQNIERMAQEVNRVMQAEPEIHTYLIEGHGFYCWAKNMAAAINQIEALEFIFSCEFERHYRC
jgi:methylthioribulose-1-phosphate dehydratase